MAVCRSAAPLSSAIHQSLQRTSPCPGSYVHLLPTRRFVFPSFALFPSRPSVAATQTTNLQSTKCSRESLEDVEAQLMPLRGPGREAEADDEGGLGCQNYVCGIVHTYYVVSKGPTYIYIIRNAITTQALWPLYFNPPPSSYLSWLCMPVGVQ